MVKNLIFAAVVFVVTVLIGIIIKTEPLMIIFAIFISLVIVSKFMIAVEHEKAWKKNNIKVVMGRPWKIVVIYPFWILFISSLILGLKVWPGNPTTNFVCFMSGAIASFILGTILWKTRPKPEIKTS
jgi:phosphatidylglycerophosphate synthase